jgi:outer membrane receptor protein involved in Fe transport
VSGVGRTGIDRSWHCPHWHWSQMALVTMALTALTSTAQLALLAAQKLRRGLTGGNGRRLVFAKQFHAQVLTGCGGDRLPYYEQINLGLSHDFGRQGLKGLTARFDVINALDKKYEIRDGTGIGVGAPQFGPRRGYFVGVAQAF